MLGILDDGRATDSKGVTVDFKNTIIIMTSNLASEQISTLKGEARDEAVKGALSAYFRPEFINRLDDVICFNPLSEDSLTQIVQIMFGELKKTLQNRGIHAELELSAAKLISAAGFDPVFGARPLRRALYDLVEDKFAEMILKDELRSGDEAVVKAEGDEIFIEVVRKA